MMLDRRVSRFLLVICGLSLVRCGDYEEKYFDQYLDHFNFGSYGQKTYRQRYLIQDRWWSRGVGPILFYTGNEGSITEFADNTGFMFDIAPEFQGLLVFAEHRFYGQSVPFNASVAFTQPYIGLLTIEQAMADFAMLITHLKKEYNATTCPVIAFGGSYGGMLSAYMRFKYPNVIVGSIAASAPIYLLVPDLDRKFFFEDVTKDFADVTTVCSDRVRQAFMTMDNLAAQGAPGLNKISNTFGLCSPLTEMSGYRHLQGWATMAFTVLAMMDYPYPTDFVGKMPAFPVKEACGYMVNTTDVVAGLAKVAGIVYNATAVQCHNIFQEFMECADPTGCGTGPNGMAWDYQSCTEVHLPSGSNNITDMFPSLPFTPEIRNQYCQQRWNVTPRDDWAAVQFWGRYLDSASNIVFSNGDLDPWRRGGVLHTTNPTLVIQLVEGGAHHLDLRGANPADPPSVKRVRDIEKGEIHKWIREHYEKLSQFSPVVIG